MVEPSVQCLITHHEQFKYMHDLLYEDCGYGKSLCDIYQMSADTKIPIEYCGLYDPVQWL